jgi:AcrR family transcriptional regulator
VARPAYTTDELTHIGDEIRTVALQLFGRHGYRGVSMRAIAKELQWSATALYRYYQNKEALLAAVRAEGFRELGEILAGIRSAGSPPMEVADSAIRAYLQFAMEQSNLYRLMYELDQGQIDEQEAVARCRRTAFAEAVGIAEDILEDANMTGDPNEMAHLFWVGAHGLAALAVAQQLDLGKRYEQLITPVVQTLIQGIATVNLGANPEEG